MATRRLKDIIKRANENYVTSVKGDYAKLTEGQYCPITYYQINDFASTHDNTLENVHSELGQNSPLIYKKIYDVSLYGLSSQDVMNQYDERGLLSTVTGEGFFLPNTIIPVAGEFFQFDLDSLREHLFRVDDVQFSDAGPSKYYKITYSVYQENADEILRNVKDEYVMQDIEDGTSTGSSIVKRADADQSDELKDAIDSLITEYKNDYFDEETNSFVYRSGNENQDILWSGYLQHFLCKTNILELFNKRILTELYLQDINGFENKDIYNENIYRASIFNAVEKQKNIVGKNQEYMFISEKSLRKRNLPYFFTPAPYKLLDIAGSDPMLYLNGFNFIVGNELEPFSKSDQYHRFVDGDELTEPFGDENGDKKTKLDYINFGDLIYQYENSIDELMPVNSYYVAEDHKTPNNESDALLLPADLKEILESPEVYTNDFAFNIVKKYINKTLTLDKNLVNQVKDYYMEFSLRSYILTPLMIYALKKLIIETKENSERPL